MVNQQQCEPHFLVAYLLGAHGALRFTELLALTGLFDGSPLSAILDR